MGVALEDVQFYVGTKALITDRKGRILLLRKVPRRKSDKWKPFWDLPGGKTQGHGLEETLARQRDRGLGLSDAVVESVKSMYRCKLYNVVFNAPSLSAHSALLL